MTGIRRTLVLITLTVAVIVGASLPASATFAETVAVRQASVATLTVAAPTGLTLTSGCTTTTTVVKRTVRTDPGTPPIQTVYSSSTTSAPSPSNVQSNVSTTVPGPGAYESTTTTTTKNTMLSVTATWVASASRGVSGYLVTAHLGDGSAYPMAQVGAATFTVTNSVDADALTVQPRLSVTTLTSYGWTAASGRTGVITC